MSYWEGVSCVEEVSCVVLGGGQLCHTVKEMQLLFHEATAIPPLTPLPFTF